MSLLSGMLMDVITGCCRRKAPCWTAPRPQLPDRPPAPWPGCRARWASANRRRRSPRYRGGRSRCDLPGIADLGEHHDHGDAKPDGDGELQNHQAPCEEAGAAVRLSTRPKLCGGPESRQDKRRIDAAEHAGDQRHSQNAERQRPVGQNVIGDRPVEETVIGRQQELRRCRRRAPRRSGTSSPIRP